MRSFGWVGCRCDGDASLGEETRIESGDGAAIVIPANSLNEDLTIKIERNPEKVQSLPPLGDDVLLLGDFYNFEITGGKLLGPVDLILPFDESLIPDADGVLIVAVPVAVNNFLLRIFAG